MSISILQVNNIKTYNFASPLTNLLSQPGSAKKRRAPEDQPTSIIHDFAFPTFCSHLQISENQNFVIAAGAYKPMMKIFDVNNLSLKHGRGIDSEILKLRILSEGYKKVAMICADRNVEIHAQYGRHFKIRTPKVGRDLIYNPFNADLVIGGSSDKIWRLNLEEGRFMKSLECGKLIDEAEGDVFGVNCLGINRHLGLLFAGADDGRLNVFDYRSKDLGKLGWFNA